MQPFTSCRLNSSGPCAKLDLLIYPDEEAALFQRYDSCDQACDKPGEPIARARDPELPLVATLSL